MVTIRRATAKDTGSIADIYNDAIRTTTATFDTEAKSEQDMLEWLQSHDDQHPVLVAVQEDRIVGWAALSEWSE